MDVFQIVIYILIIFFGLSVGSFLNVVVSRFDDIESIIKTRSHCPKCKKNLPWYDLVPFFSYFVLSGRCRFCKKTISIQYPIVEAATAIIFALTYFYYGISIDAFFVAIIFSFLIVIAAYDAVRSEIPDVLIYTAAVFVLGWLLYFLWRSSELTLAGFSNYLYGFLIGAGFFGLLVVLSRQKWMGWGDVLLGGLIGLFLGYPDILVALFFAFMIGSIFSIILMILKIKKMKDAIPFGPFLVLGALIALFWGERIINAYFTRMGIW